MTTAKKYIFDSSAVLALLYQEQISENLEQYLEHSIINLVNASEVLTVLQNRGMPKDIAIETLQSTIKEIIPISFTDSCLAAELKFKYKHLGISIGDSFCLATAILLDCPVITADKIWNQLNIPVLSVILIR